MNRSITLLILPLLLGSVSRAWWVDYSFEPKAIANGNDRTPIIRATPNVGFPYNSDPGRSPDEAQALLRRKDHFDPERA